MKKAIKNGMATAYCWSFSGSVLQFGGDCGKSQEKNRGGNPFMLVKLFVVILSVFIWQPVFAQPSDSYSPPTCGFLKKVTPLQIDGVAMTELEIEEENGNIVYFHIDPTDESSENCTEVKGLMCWDIKGWIRYKPNKRSKLTKRLYFINNCIAPG